jgi:hypothetical protein
MSIPMKTLYDALHENDPDYKPAGTVTVDPTVEELSNLHGKAFAKALLQSKDYRESLVRRMKTDSLPSAIECKLMDHAWGVPKQRLEVEDKTNSYEGLSAEQIQTRIRTLMDVAQRLGASKEDDSTSVH